jgi:hypothetical protein
MSLFRKSKAKVQPPIEYKFYISLSPDEAMRSLKEWTASDIQLGNVEPLDNGYKFDMELIAGQVTMLGVEGYLYEIPKMDDKSETHAKLIWKSEKQWVGRFDYIGRKSDGVSINSRQSSVILVGIGIAVLVLVNTILQNMEIDILEFFGSLPIVRGYAFGFPLLCLGTIGFSVIIMWIMGIVLLNRILPKRPEMIAASGEIWAGFKPRLMTHLRTHLK